MRYLLDTNICIYLSKRNHPGLRAKLAQIPVAEAGISVVTYGELVYGAFKSERRKENLHTIGELIEAFQPLPLPVEAGQAYGSIKESLRAKGQIIGENDLWIASHALAGGYVLVTNNMREFKRIKGLQLENWAA
ncbi:MAG: type II toxin-antitoxin system VapC family toxin [Burkholderiales bacterium]|nr:type II toxin-antitoxin system VapC family toxin [Burkholderiales bacterium]